MNERVKPESRDKKLDFNTKNALDEIGLIMQETSMMGNNDFELSAIRLIMEQVSKGGFEGRLQEAINEALKIKNSKNER